MKFNNDLLIYFICIILFAFVFLLELSTTRGVSEAVLYAPVILIALLFKSTRSYVFISAISIFLTILGYFLSPPGHMMFINTIIDRIVSITLLLSISYIGLLFRGAKKEVEEYTKKLQHSNSELEQFAYVASHDLQEPLRAVSTYTVMLKNEYHDKLSKEADTYIDFIVDGAQRMQSLINNILEYSQIGNIDEGFKEVDLNTSVKDALHNLTQTIKESNAEIICAPLPTLKGNSLRFVELFQNLIENAIKYRSDKTPQIYIKATNKDNAEWVFSINDNGIGINPKHSKRIFQIFQRLHTRDKYKGTGVGLALCKKIIKQHNGEIWVESKLGEGATFYFTIPIVPR